MVKTAPQNIIAVIPARGGSKRIPRKNLMEILGLPLVAHSILQARHSRYVKHIYVSTEDSEIAKVAKYYGAEVVRRPKRLAADTASSESVLLHVLDYLRKPGKRDPDLVVFLQPTSPLRRLSDIDRAIETLAAQKADSLLAVCRDKSLIWRRKGEHMASITYDFQNRIREQDRGVQYRETGALYVFKPEILRKHNNRLGGRIAVYQMGRPYAYEVDEPKDVKWFELMKILTRENDAARLPKTVRLVVFDFDGVFTDNTVKTDAQGNEYVITSRTDSLGLDFLRKARIPAMALSTEKHPVVAKRCEKLKLPCHQGIGSKKEYLAKYLKAHKIKLENVVYVGNDVNDLECFRFVGFTAAPADSHSKVLAEADYILTHKGGRGAVREICELIVSSLPLRGRD